MLGLGLLYPLSDACVLGVAASSLKASHPAWCRLPLLFKEKLPATYRRQGVLEMLPLFGDERRRREINLGGSTSVSSQAAILDQARAQRMEREAQRKREESAIRIQAWWRGAREAQRVRQQLRQAFREQVTGLTALRCLVLVGQDEELLSLWSVTIHQDDGGYILL